MTPSRTLWLSCSFAALAWFGAFGPAQEATTEGLVTLYAGDDLQSSFDFRRGLPGGQVFDGEVELSNAQIAYDVFAPDRISFGFVRDERIEVLDLGDIVVPPQVRARDRALAFPISLFHTLSKRGSSFVYLGPGGDVHAFDPADRILGGTPGLGLRHVEPHVGHTYLVRARLEGVGLPDELYKFEIVDHLPGHSVTLRWGRVPGR